MRPRPDGFVTVAGLAARVLGLRDYVPVWRAMQQFTEQRDAGTPDEVWLVEHPPIFTMGVRGSPQDVLHASSVPVVRVDRGGLVTYHGPGQLLCYVLLDLRRRGLGVRDVVDVLERAVVDLLAARRIPAAPHRDAPGVYVSGRKIASVGLRVRRGCCYHGVALNVAMDLAPFRDIRPCGAEALEMTQLRDLAGDVEPLRVGAEMVGRLAQHLKEEAQWL
jgi:lipoyl(octanoyl) transferase